MPAQEIVLFESSDGAVTLPVEVDHDTVWLSQAQMAELFGRNVTVISRHIRNVFEEAEVERESNLHYLQIASSDRPVAFYSLDVIISVGYRVKSQRGVEFRRWATDVLRQYITTGYAANERRLQELGKVVNVMARLPQGDLATHQVLQIIKSYTTALDLLDDYDNQTLKQPQGTTGSYVLGYEKCREVVASMRFGNESSLFGVEKDDSFRASIGDIYAGFAGQEAMVSLVMHFLAK